MFGMGGALISPALSKWTAKRLTGAEIITTPCNEREGWLFFSQPIHPSRIELGHCKSPHILRLEFFSSSCWGRNFTVNLTFTLKFRTTDVS